MFDGKPVRVGSVGDAFSASVAELLAKSTRQGALDQLVGAERLDDRRHGLRVAVKRQKTAVRAEALKNGAAMAAASEGAAPVVVAKVAADSSFSMDWGPQGRVFDNGCYICNSSTRATKTIGSADCWFDAQYT